MAQRSKIGAARTWKPHALMQAGDDTIAASSKFDDAPAAPRYCLITYGPQLAFRMCCAHVLMLHWTANNVAYLHSQSLVAYKGKY